MPPGFDPAGGLLRAVLGGVYDFLAGLLSRPRGADPETAVSIQMPLGSGYDRAAWSEQKRAALEARARGYLGTRYKLGAEVERHDERPPFIDCSELTERVFCDEGLPLVDGAQAQHGATQAPSGGPAPCDLGFLHYTSRRTGLDRWHVGIRTASGTVIHASFAAGAVVEEPAEAFEAREGWLGWRRHPELL